MDKTSFDKPLNVRSKTVWVVGSEAKGKYAIQLSEPRPLAWTVLPNIHGKNFNIPTVSGIYAYAEVRRAFGLPVSVTWKYVGKSKNLKQRISNGHDVRNEANPRLRCWLNRHPAHAELWFAPVPEGELDAVESQLVRTAQPDFNIRLR
jgi:excinuclease UvrABC nuclease subunit